MNKRTARKIFKKLKRLQREYGKMNAYLTWEEKVIPYDHFTLILHTSPTTQYTVNVIIDMLLFVNTRDIIKKLEYRWASNKMDLWDKNTKEASEFL